MVTVAGGRGAQPRHFVTPSQLAVAADGAVFVADRGNNHVQVLTADLTFASVVGAGDLRDPSGVCVSAPTSSS